MRQVVFFQRVCIQALTKKTTGKRRDEKVLYVLFDKNDSGVFGLIPSMIYVLREKQTCQDFVTHSGLPVSLMGFPQSGRGYVQVQTLIHQHLALIL